MLLLTGSQSGYDSPSVRYDGRGFFIARDATHRTIGRQVQHDTHARGNHIMSTTSSKPAIAILPPAMAGSFYPAEPAALCARIGNDLHAARQCDITPKALIVPHAGYVYSGPVAATAYATLSRVRNVVRKVVLLGPAHHSPFDGLAASAAEACATPLGTVRVDRAAVARALELPQICLFDAAFCGEHCLEVQLPFLQIMLSNFEIAPFLVGESTAEDVRQLLELLWGGPETLIVISSDLSHFHAYPKAQALDRAAAQVIVNLDPDKLLPDQACGGTAVRGLLLAARSHGLHGHTLDLRNSGDTAGPRHEVVGYGAFAFAQPN